MYLPLIGIAVLILLLLVLVLGLWVLIVLRAILSKMSLLATKVASICSFPTDTWVFLSTSLARRIGDVIAILSPVVLFRLEDFLLSLAIKIPLPLVLSELFGTLTGVACLSLSICFRTLTRLC